MKIRMRMLESDEIMTKRRTRREMKKNNKRRAGRGT
jgi:hypothetical protein